MYEIVFNLFCDWFFDKRYKLVNKIVYGVIFYQNLIVDKLEKLKYYKNKFYFKISYWKMLF